MTSVGRTGADTAVNLGLIIVVLFFIGGGYIAYWNTKVLSKNTAQVTHTHEVILALNDLSALVKDAETGQRGFLITGDEKYLQPYSSARKNINERLNRIDSLISDNESQQLRLIKVKSFMSNKLLELQETINLRRTRGFEAARDVVITDHGKSEMDLFRSTLKSMQLEEQDLRASRLEEMRRAYRMAIFTGLITGLLGVLLSLAVAQLINRATKARQRQEWLRAGQVGLTEAMLGDQRIEQLGDNILKFLAQYFDAHAGALFTKHGTNNYRRVSTYGVPLKDSKTPSEFMIGDGLLGQAVKDNRTFIVKDVPDGYLTFGSALGQDKPKQLIISPADADGLIHGVIELGFVHPLNEMTLELMENVSESIGIAIRSSEYRSHLQNLLEETQRQSEELQTQSEELRVSNEELEEQSNTLKESQARLEQQQAELEQTNSQLEEQTQLLEAQKDDLSRSREIQQQKAKELEQASQYKSDFLANMSHELRTPLNSSLILAKLLADNPDENLTSEQVRFAETIQSSGNDLLNLINDILDLSKIEAGHMEIKPETVYISRLVEDLVRLFDPIAQQKNLLFQPSITVDCPQIIETDRQRFEQVLKNLLSNAFKFTESGKVELLISKSHNNEIQFSIKDTGIGISQEQQLLVFDAFRQADGTTSRKYGGTGLGLSISRELVRLLGGKIELESTVGKGSIFTVTLPELHSIENVQDRDSLIISDQEDTEYNKTSKNSLPADTSNSYKKNYIEDDRNKLNNSNRLILIVEDDESFARILYDLAHELDFQCIVANTAEDALIIAKQYLPSAVILDLGLPDNSGLSVLDRLKRDARTRHIPVHIVSGNDHAQTALSLGAVGYMFKPVKREELAEVLIQLEAKMTQGMRRVLVVEDDKVQRESVIKLLSSKEVETIGVGTAAECLDYLKETTFDCMVLDLSLPDATGYSLLETLSQEDAYSFPPVIVYTGRDLSTAEEIKLRRYSKSIIIKGAKSPERLLDEVTLFLHKVESDLPVEQQRMLKKARNRDAVLEGRKVLIVEDDVRNVYALTNILEPHGVEIKIARNGKEALALLEESSKDPSNTIDLVLMDVMMPEMDGITATREIRKRTDMKKLPIIMLTAKAMKDDQERCLESGANDYMAKPLDVEKLLSLVRVWMPR